MKSLVKTLTALLTEPAATQVVSLLVQLQDLASQNQRAEPLHVIASVRHPRTIELINYVTMHSRSTAATGQKDIDAVKAVTTNHHQQSQAGTCASQSAGSSSEGVQGVDSGVRQKGAEQHVLNVDVLLLDELLSGLLTQASVQLKLLGVMNDLFDNDGKACHGRQVLHGSDLLTCALQLQCLCLAIAMPVTCSDFCGTTLAA